MGVVYQIPCASYSKINGHWPDRQVSATPPEVAQKGTDIQEYILVSMYTAKMYCNWPNALKELEGSKSGHLPSQKCLTSIGAWNNCTEYQTMNRDEGPLLSEYTYINQSIKPTVENVTPVLCIQTNPLTCSLTVYSLNLLINHTTPLLACCTCACCPSYYTHH